MSFDGTRQQSDDTFWKDQKQAAQPPAIMALDSEFSFFIEKLQNLGCYELSLPRPKNPGLTRLISILSARDAFCSRELPAVFQFYHALCNNKFASNLQAFPLFNGFCCSVL